MTWVCRPCNMDNITVVTRKSFGTYPPLNFLYHNWVYAFNCTLFLDINNLSVGAHVFRISALKI